MMVVYVGSIVFTAFPRSFLRKFVHIQTIKTMADWQVEKDKFLDMKLEEKRKFYKTFYTVDDILTWKEYADKHQPLPEKIPRLINNEIDESKNKSLVDKISVFKGDITTLEVDCIVNAANSSLLGGGGVDGAIHRAAGSNLNKECRTLNGCQVGEAKITGGYQLPAKYVIHTVGPQGEKPGFLTECYRNSLNVMKSKNLRTIAFPCISTGIYGYPVEPASHIAAIQVRKHLEENPDKVDRVIFCLFSPEDENVYQKILQSYFPLS